MTYITSRTFTTGTLHYSRSYMKYPDMSVIPFDSHKKSFLKFCKKPKICRRRNNSFYRFIK
uniref:Uncharacterized protein n=1 Tax=Meloidogyne enterolobii TaxID=390850 RepID=A0A6V7VVR7_MELEN|nr:unnamed protein product [Meloidogyne enterolobii]